MRSILFIICFYITTIVSGQSTQKIELAIGDTLWVGTCEGKDHFEYIDLITKTRIPDTTMSYDTVTGEGFYQYFFANGDMDGKRLPCFYQNEPIIVASSIKAKDKNTKEERIVIVAWVNKSKLQVAWIEIGTAIEHGEIILKK